MAVFIALNAVGFAFLEKSFTLSKAFYCDLIFGLINPILVNFSIGILLKIYFIQTGSWAIIDLPSMMPIGVLYVLAIIFSDLWGYAWHSLYHHTPLWRLHFIHHSTQELRWHSILRFHPLETILTHSTLFIVLGTVGIPFKNYVVVNIVLFFFSALSHARVSWGYGLFGKIFVSPVYHSIHHQKSTQHANLGLLFVWWDQILGKSLFEKGNSTETADGHDSWIKLICHPFRIK